MIKKPTICILFSFILFLSFLFQTYALEKKTHEALNEYIARSANNFSLDAYLRNQLGLEKGIEESVNNRAIWDWLGEGGKKEDEPFFRSPNHFHNPITEEGFSGFLNTWWFTGESALLWAQLDEGTQDPGGHYSWHDVRNYFYKALTESSSGAREYYYVETFRGVGQLMHLVQDMSVPEHTRDDGHYLGQFGLVYYEQWVNNNYNESVISNILPISVDKSIFDEINQQADVRIANLFDTDQYDGSNPAITLNNSTIGLSEYTNANFLSSDTMFVNEFPFPSISDCVFYLDYINNRRYLSTDHDNNYSTEKVTHLATLSPLHYWRVRYFPQVHGYLPLALDDSCYEEYASHLMPRAVGYSSKLLEYFLRGKIDLVGNEYQLYYIKNNTDEEMEGIFELYYDHVLGHRLLVPNSPFPLVTTITANGKSVSITFPIPSNAKEPGKYILVFRGRMGNENGAVVGKVVSPSSMIAFQLQPGGPGQGNSNIHIIYPDGTGERQITNSGDGLMPYKYGPAWSPDGTKLAFYTETASSGYDIIVVDMTSKEEYPDNILYRLDADHDEYDPSFSPDGQKIVAIRHGAGGNDEIIIFNLSTGLWYSFGEVGESGSVMISGGAARSANWSPDGQKIAYCSYPDIGTLKHDIFTIDADTGFKVNVTNSSWASDQEPSWSPDGKYIVFCSDRDGGDHLDIWLYDTDTGQYYQLTDFITSCHSPDFSPDGKKVVFSGYHYAGTPPDEYINYYGIIYLNDIYDGEAGFTILKDPEILENEPAWSPAFYSPSIDVFEAEPASIPPGGSTTLNWETTNAYSCRIETESGQDLGCDDLNGAVTVNPSETTTYTITAYGKAGSRVSASVIVTVTQ